MLQVEPEELVAPTLPGINGQPVLLHLPKIRTTLFFMMVKYCLIDITGTTEIPVTCIGTGIARYIPVP
jgi:hypothetical protein